MVDPIFSAKFFLAFLATIGTSATSVSDTDELTTRYIYHRKCLIQISHFPKARRHPPSHAPSCIAWLTPRGSHAPLLQPRMTASLEAIFVAASIVGVLFIPSFQIHPQILFSTHIKLCSCSNNPYFTAFACFFNHQLSWEITLPLVL